MIRCARCGTENPEGSRFCAQCGNQLATLEPEPAPPPVTSAPSPPPSSNEPPGVGPVTGESVPRRAADPSALPPTAPEWRMSDAGPLPEPRGRRKWLWIALGVSGACLLICILVVIWANTIGADVVSELLATAEAQATAAAGGN